MEFEEFEVRAQLVKTEVYHLNPADDVIANAEQEVHYFFIPGNPGSVYFYLSWLQNFYHRIVQYFDNQFGVGKTACYLHGYSHANHHFKESESAENIPSDAHDLSFQIDHSNSFIDAVLKRSNNSINRKRMCIYCGHSIGAYIILQVLNNAKNLISECISVILVTPFIAFKQLPLSQKVFLSLVNASEGFTSFFANFSRRFLNNIPLVFRKQLIRKLTAESMDESCSEVIASRLFTRRLVENFLRMGHEEIDSVFFNEDLMFSIIKSLSGRVRILSVYTDNDVWAPLGDKVILDSMPHMHTEFIEGIDHAFSMHYKAHYGVSNVIIKFISDGIRKSGGQNKAKTSVDVNNTMIIQRARL